ncbi:MAG: hypothetical protein IJ626_01030 [Muribaculaceae bacterium]|nr:hypothetical protein [Muribaculaceae bacterium]
MKRLFTYVCAVMLAMLAYAQTSSVTFSESLANGDKNPTVNLGGELTITFSKANGTTDPQYYSNGNALRVYKYNSIMVQTLNEATIKSISFVHPSYGYAFKPYNTSSTQKEKDLIDLGLVVPDVQGSTCVYDGNVTSTWTGPATHGVTHVTLTLGNIAVTRITSMVIETEGGETYSLETPMIEPTGGEITTDTYIIFTPTSYFRGGLRYTLDGTDPKYGGEEYTGAFTLQNDATVSVRGYSVDDFGEYTWSGLAQTTFTVRHTVNSVAEYNALPTGTRVEFTCNMYAVYQSGSYLYLRDDNGDIILVYGNVGQTYENGYRIQSNIIGTKSDYSGLTELTSPDNFSSGVGGGNTAWPEGVTIISSLTADNQSQLFAIQGRAKDITTISGKAAFTLVDLQDESEILVYNRFGIEDFSKVKEGDYVGAHGFLAIYNGALQFYPYYLPYEENGIEFTPQGGTYNEPQTVYANYSTVSGEPFGITLSAKFDDGTTGTVNDDNGGIYVDRSGWVYATMRYYSSAFSMELTYTDSARYEILLPITFSYDLDLKEVYYRPMTLHITAAQGDTPFTGIIYYNLQGDTTTANASIYNPEVGIRLTEPTTLAVWAFDTAGNRYENYPYFEVYDYGPAYFDMSIQPEAGVYYGRKMVYASASGDNAFLREGTWKVLFEDGTSAEGEFNDNGYCSVVMDKTGKLILDYTYWDDNYQESHNVKDTLEYTILPALKITFDPAAGKYSGTQNVYVGFEVQDPSSYFGFESRNWTMYYDDGTIYTGNFDDNETVEVHGSGSLQVEAYCYDEVGNITYADSARYEIVQPTLTIIPEPGTYYGALTPKIEVENIDYDYELRYSIRYDDGEIVGPNYDPVPEEGFTITKNGMVYVSVIWYDETGMQHYLSKDRLYYEIKPAVQDDINQDGAIDVADLTLLSSLVMGDSVNYYNSAMVDVNGDGIVDVTDVVALANKIMGN